MSLSPKAHTCLPSFAGLKLESVLELAGSHADFIMVSQRHVLNVFKGRHLSRQKFVKNMLGDLFVKCMRLVTNNHLFYLWGGTDYYVM